MTQLAIQDDMLPGHTLTERYHRAADLGFDGIELWADGLEAPSEDSPRLAQYLFTYPW